MNYAKQLQLRQVAPTPQAAKAIQEAILPSDKEEDKFRPWEPSGDVDDTISTLNVFQTFRRDDGKKMSKKEKSASYKNFDGWLTNEIDEIYDMLKAKDGDVFN